MGDAPSKGTPHEIVDHDYLAEQLRHAEERMVEAERAQRQAEQLALALGAFQARSKWLTDNEDFVDRDTDPETGEMGTETQKRLDSECEAGPTAGVAMLHWLIRNDEFVRRDRDPETGNWGPETQRQLDEIFDTISEKEGTRTAENAPMELPGTDGEADEPKSGTLGSWQMGGSGKRSVARQDKG